MMSKKDLVTMMVLTANLLPKAESKLTAIGMPDTQEWLLYKASIINEMTEDEINDELIKEWLLYCLPYIAHGAGLTPEEAIEKLN